MGKLKSLPKIIYVVLEEDGDDSNYLIASEDIDSFSDGTSVGVYTRVQTQTKATTHELID